jgi:putative phosphoesterase
MLRIGLVSDTHGLLRPEVLSFLRGSDHILHAGDICTADILEQLALLAPVTAVRGNNDRGTWADRLAASEIVHFEDVWVHMLHDLGDLDIDLAGAGIQVLVCGHSHRPRVEERDGVLRVNPGSAGPRRFSLPIAAAELLVDGAKVSARVVEF